MAVALATSPDRDIAEPPHSIVIFLPERVAAYSRWL
jgi:hypothetical protein